MPVEAIMPLNIDSTMIACARQCLEKFRFEFVYGLRPAGISIDLHAGGCFATALEAVRKAYYQKNKDMDSALLEGHGAFTCAWGDFEIPTYKKTYKTFDRTWAAVEAYFDKWPCATDHLQPYFVEGKPTFEYTFAVPLEPTVPANVVLKNGQPGYTSYDPDDHWVMLEERTPAFPMHPSGEPWLYSGRLDMLGKYQSRPCFADEKTQGGSISSGWADKWRLRSQFIGYTWSCQETGIDLDTGVVRGIAIQQTQIPLEEAVIPISDHLIAKWHEQLRRDLWRIRKAWDSGYFDPNLADACTQYGNCIFMDICGSHPSMRDNWFNDYEVRRWNPLIKNPIAQSPLAA